MRDLFIENKIFHHPFRTFNAAQLNKLLVCTQLGLEDTRVVNRGAGQGHMYCTLETTLILQLHCHVKIPPNHQVVFEQKFESYILHMHNVLMSNDFSL